MLGALSRQAANAFFGILCVAVALPADAQDERSWGVSESEPGQVSLIYGTPETDDITLTFTCVNRLTKLHYAFEREEKPYGTTEPLTVIVRFGRKQITASATATFDEDGSPWIETEDSASSALMAGLANGGRITTVDRWGGSSAPTVPATRLKEWRGKCSAQMPRRRTSAIHQNQTSYSRSC